ncbi:MAG TPA: hypothetical protein VMX14_03580 [Anaerolineae bacterium]|nr:hypothetical protein [Anaerolineae bacterium]HUW13355.1 hypothetical protein [Anaerolineae bacterium]
MAELVRECRCPACGESFLLQRCSSTPSANGTNVWLFALLVACPHCNATFAVRKLLAAQGKEEVDGNPV